jgi:hypothetical protein
VEILALLIWIACFARWLNQNADDDFSKNIFHQEYKFS